MSTRGAFTSNFFNPTNFPSTGNCQVLDAQISRLRNEKDLVYRGQMSGVRRDVKDLLLSKELQFAKQDCSRTLENESVLGTIKIIQDEFEDSEDRIIGEGNKKKQVLLIGGSIVLLIGLAILIK